MNYYHKIGFLIVLSIIAIPMLVYGFIGFISWLAHDPWNIIQDVEPVEFRENADVLKCRESGGYPVKSGWDGSLKECKKFENQTP